MTDRFQGSSAQDALWNTFGITPKDIAELKIIESSVYLTRKCNLACQYCKIIKTTLPEELTTRQWVEAFDILESLGIRFVNIAGGEPTILKGLGKMVAHLNNKTSMRYSIVSNSIFNDRKLDELVNAGLKTFVASVDVIEDNNGDLGSIRKSSAGLKMLKKLQNRNVPELCGNIVITGQNIDKVMPVVRYLNDNGFWTSICPIVWGKGDNWEEIEKADESYRLTAADKGKLEEIANELLEMKKNGGLILSTENYIKNMATYGISGNWKCYMEKGSPYPPRLFIDADGSIMSCINFRGDTVTKYSIFDFKDPSVYEKFIREWWDDVAQCPGCYWSTMYMAKERQDMVHHFKQTMPDIPQSG
jgi:MoaA/NifB/PqqE/SkfB family radical SAM enzyme